jgi:aminoglycoside phosphotransferase (APT) family kinase protein
MTFADESALRRLIPETITGAIQAITPIRAGLSGAGVYAVVASRGGYVLRTQAPSYDADAWTEHLLVSRRVADGGVAPPIVHVDEAARAVLSVKVEGAPLPAALADPAQRRPALAGVVAQLRTLHALEPTGLPARDAVAYARGTWEAQGARAGFPAWMTSIGAVLDGIAAALARDPRRVVSHNDLNPGNVLWDGARAWLVDWDVGGLAHPHYDLAALATFLTLDDDAAHGLLALQEQAPMDERDRATFAALRRLVALAAGFTFLGLVPDLAIFPAPTRADAPTLQACYAEMRAGTTSLQDPKGRAAMGLALLRIATEGV